MNYSMAKKKNCDDKQWCAGRFWFCACDHMDDTLTLSLSWQRKNAIQAGIYTFKKFCK